MLDHHIQRSIVYRLALSEGLRFSELKPDTLDNKLFTYHLQKVVTAGYVHKNDDGLYSLTPEGRRLGIRVLNSSQELVDRADSVLFLVIRRKTDGAWLLYQRKAHPLINKQGFMHCHPNSFEDTTKTAKDIVHESTGLICNFRPLGSGYFRIYDHDNLESFTHFTLLVSEDAAGELRAHDEHAEYEWIVDPDFSSDAMLPNMQILKDLYSSNQPFFIEKTIKA